VPIETLTAQQAAVVLGTLRGVAGPVDGLRKSATDTLKAIAAGSERPDHPGDAENLQYVGLVVVDRTNAVEVVAGNVALVDFHDLDADPDISASAIEQLAESVEGDIGERAGDIVKDLRELAHERRVEALHNEQRITNCTAAQLDQAMQSAELDACEVTVVEATVKRPTG
jgi:hypothetical protein